jgi:hypothetical protein
MRLPGASADDLGDMAEIRGLIGGAVSDVPRADIYTFVVYGTYDGVANSAGVYHITTSANSGSDFTDLTSSATDIPAIELVAVMSGGITEDALVSTNFLG